MIEALDDEGLHFPIDVVSIVNRSNAYVDRCERWLDRGTNTEDRGADIESRTVVARMSAVVATEITRAFEGWLCAAHGREELTDDPEGAATVALNAIERSRRAWLALVETHAVRAIAAAPFVTDLVWLKHEIARAFPGAIGHQTSQTARPPVQNPL